MNRKHYTRILVEERRPFCQPKTMEQLHEMYALVPTKHFQSRKYDVFASNWEIIWQSSRVAYQTLLIGKYRATVMVHIHTHTQSRTLTQTGVPDISVMMQAFANSYDNAAVVIIQWKIHIHINQMNEMNMNMTKHTTHKLLYYRPMAMN